MGSNTWLAPYTPRPEAEFRIFLLPYAGGSSAIYRQWESLVPSFIEVCPVQLPGRSTRYSEAPCRRIDELVKRMLKGLSREIERSYVLFGHSMGSLIAYEWARQAKLDKYNSPEMLFVSGSLPPHAQRTDAYHKLPDTEFIQMLKSYQGTPNDVFTNRELLSIILP